jgi:hypothetical protein
MKIVRPLLCILSPLAFAACAPEAIQVITPRPAASADAVRDAGANRADEADQRLRESTDQAAHVQDILDEPVRMQDEPNYIVWRDE